MENKHIINSLLDTDIYKFYMSQVALFFFPNMRVKYQFILREDRNFPDGFDRRLQEEINHLATLKLSPEEYLWLKNNPNIYSHYLNWFNQYRFNPSDVTITFINNKLGLTIEGLWMGVALWEVPLLAIISELFFEMTEEPIQSRVFWDASKKKGKELVDIPFVEFGTRRRLSFSAQHNVIMALTCSHSNGNIVGTSNPYFAMKNRIWVVGTYAHEAPMAMQSLVDPKTADAVWLKYWKTMYGKMLNVALSDTLTTDHFLNSVDDTMFRLLDGIRQDSGNPVEIGNKIIKKWESLGIDPKTKNIVFSDNLNPKKTRVLWDVFKDKTNPIFGIGTNLTNDFGVTPLNMVIKMTQANGKPVVKLSDDLGKASGSPIVVEAFKKELGI